MSKCGPKRKVSCLCFIYLSSERLLNTGKGLRRLDELPLNFKIKSLSTLTFKRAAAANVSQHKAG